MTIQKSVRAATAATGRQYTSPGPASGRSDACGASINPYMRARVFAPGLALTGLIALVAMWIEQLSWPRAHGISALTLAIGAGMLIGNTVYGHVATVAETGVALSKGQLLRLGIVLYGFRLTISDMASVGWLGVVIDAVVISSTFALACILGTRVLGMDRGTAMLIGAGSSICGAAAVIATGPVVRARAEQVAVAVATVVVFGTLAMILYPTIYRLGGEYGISNLSATGYGVFVGSTVHEVAQVVVAGRAGGPHASDVAVIVKMVRVMMLAPFLMLLSAWMMRAAPRGSVRGAGFIIPWFAIGFLSVAGVNSLAVLPDTVVRHMMLLDQWLLAAAMAGLGLTTHAASLHKAGLKPLLLGAVLFAWLLGGGYAINVCATNLVG